MAYTNFKDACSRFDICNDNNNRSFILEYTTDSSDFNNKLIKFMKNFFQGDKSGDEINMPLETSTKTCGEMCLLLLNAYLYHLGKYIHNPYFMTLYHGGKLFEQVEQDNKTVRILGFLSTSFKESVAVEFVGKGSHLYIINIPSTMRPMCISNCSEFSHEREFLLPIGTQLTINKYVDEHDIMCIYCTATPPSKEDITTFSSLFKQVKPVKPVKTGGLVEEAVKELPIVGNQVK